MYGNVVVGHRGRALRGRDQGHQEGSRRVAGHRAGRRRAARADRDVQGLLRLPGRSAGAAGGRDPGGLRLLDRQAGDRVPPHQPHPRRLGHGGQRPADGLRQQGGDVGIGRRVLARRGHRRARAVRRLPAQRPGRGRGQRRPHAARHPRAAGVAARGPRAAVRRSCGSSSSTTATCRTRSSPWKRASCTCCRRATPSARRRRRCASRSTRWARGCSTRPARWRRSRPRSSTRCCTRPSTRTPPTTCSPAAWRRRRARPRARSSSSPTTRSPPRPKGARWCWSASSPRPRTSRASTPPKGVLTSEGGKASHAALVARGMGVPAVTGAGSLEIDVHKPARSSSAARSCCARAT